MRPDLLSTHEKTGVNVIKWCTVCMTSGAKYLQLMCSETDLFVLLFLHACSERGLFTVLMESFDANC